MTHGPERYVEDMNLVALVARMARLGPDPEPMLRAVERAESVGPLLDPTAYRKNSHQLPWQRKLLEAYARLRTAATEVAEEVERTLQPRDAAPQPAGSSERDRDPSPAPAASRFPTPEDTP